MEKGDEEAWDEKETGEGDCGDAFQIGGVRDGEPFSDPGSDGSSVTTTLAVPRTARAKEPEVRKGRMIWSRKGLWRPYGHACAVLMPWNS